MKTTALILFVAIYGTAFGQKYTAEKTFVSFYSHAAIEDIKAENTKSQSIFDLSNGEVAFIIPITDFEFAKPLMKEHFNEKYMDTEKFPKANFQGKINGFDPKVAGAQKATATGKMTIHGVTNEVEIPGTIEFIEGKIVMKAAWIIVLEKYNITRPQLLWQNIAEQVEVKMEFTYKSL